MIMENFNPHPLCRELKERRKMLRRSQADVGDATGIGQPRVSDYECGRHQPSIATLELWANELGLALHLAKGRRR
jgi:transcriptional regulator with XRE-family HTH domain